MQTRAVLFDVDGTLIDSNDAHARAWAAAFSAFGYDVGFERIRPLIGMGGDRIIPHFAPGLSADEGRGKQISELRGRLFKERELPNIQPHPGARELLAGVRARGARVVVATSAKKNELDDLLARGDLGPLVDVATTSDDAERSKPAADIIAAALDKAGVTPREAVYVGDTRWDVDAAHKAHLPCIALRCGGNDPATLAGAELIYADPAELKSALDAPPFVWSKAASTAP